MRRVKGKEDRWSRRGNREEDERGGWVRQRGCGERLAGSEDGDE